MRCDYILYTVIDSTKQGVYKFIYPRRIYLYIKVIVKTTIEYILQVNLLILCLSNVMNQMRMPMVKKHFSII